MARKPTKARAKQPHQTSKNKTRTKKAENKKTKQAIQVAEAQPKPAQNPGGRPTKYKPEYVGIAREMCMLGATDADLARAFDCTTQSIWNWMARHREFFEAIRVGKDLPDDRVERSLYQRAIGYTFDAEKVFCSNGRIARAAVVEHVPPDIGAAKLWLTNRRPDKWRDKVATELTGKDGGAIEFIESPRDRILSRIEDIAKRKVSSTG